MDHSIVDSPPFDLPNSDPPKESNAERVVRICRQALNAGPMGRDTRKEFYREFIACEQEPDGGKSLSTIATSCGIFVRAVWFWAGAATKTGAKPGWPFFGGWLSDRNTNHRAWIPYRPGNKPTPGSVFFIEKPGTNNNHVGVFLAEKSPGIWETAEGGGSGDGGTRCNLSSRNLSAFDSYGRILRGWWDPELIPMDDRSGRMPGLPSAAELLALAKDVGSIVASLDNDSNKGNSDKEIV